MTTIGICDSGIGGLTTLKILRQNFPFADFYYLADNKNMPYGTKSKDELTGICSNLLKKLKAHSDVQVIACNTASSLLADGDAIKLLPPATCGKTLVMATPMTVERLKGVGAFQNNDISFSDTPELATLVEVYTSVGVRKNCLNMRELLPYLANKLFEFKGVENVVLGCSHYLYLKNEISMILGAVNFFDGNSKIVDTLKELLPKERGQGKTTFDFTADDESKKYSAILTMLEKDNTFYRTASIKI
ncbi:MAG: aspartate/glutamate racemase family protein [Clostridia bacterium]|nr:aspartate/glutamate racemase family protein [Clostridia bacterium]